MVNEFDLTCDNCGVKARVITNRPYTLTGQTIGPPSYCPKCKIIENDNLLHKCKCGEKLPPILYFPKQAEYEEPIMKCPLCEKETLRCKLIEEYEV